MVRGLPRNPLDRKEPGERWTKLLQRRVEEEYATTNIRLLPRVVWTQEGIEECVITQLGRDLVQTLLPQWTRR